MNAYSTAKRNIEVFNQWNTGNKDYNEFWETCHPDFAHLTDWTDCQIPLWKDGFLDKDWVQFQGKRVVDYGIGGGYLGKLLFDEYNIKEYIGIDISQRSLDTAKENISRDNTTFILTPVNLSTITADVFISLACIQHLNEQDYIDLMDNINTSNIEALILQVRIGEKLEFTDNIQFGCYTTVKDIQERLSNYNIIRTSNVADNGYQYIWLLRDPFANYRVNINGSNI